MVRTRLRIEPDGWRVSIQLAAVVLSRHSNSGSGWGATNDLGVTPKPTGNDRGEPVNVNDVVNLWFVGYLVSHSYGSAKCLRYHRVQMWERLYCSAKVHKGLGLLLRKN